MVKREKRVLSAEYLDGSRQAIAFLRSERIRDGVPWDVAADFHAICAGQTLESRAGFQDTVFLFLQCTLQGAPANLNDESDCWLLDLEDPYRGWMEDGENPEEESHLVTAQAFGATCVAAQSREDAHA